MIFHTEISQLQHSLQLLPLQNNVDFSRAAHADCATFIFLRVSEGRELFSRNLSPSLSYTVQWQTDVVIGGSTEKDREILGRFVIHAKGRHIIEQLPLVANEP